MYQEDKTIINILDPIKELHMHDTKTGKKNIYKILAADFKTPFLTMNRTTRQNYHNIDLKNTITLIYYIIKNIYDATTSDYTIISSTHCIVIKIDHMLNNKISQYNLKDVNHKRIFSLAKT